MTEQVTQRRASVGFFTVDGKFEIRQVLINRIVPGHLALVHQHSDQSRCERLGGRSDGEERVLIHGQLALDVAQPEAALQHDLAIGDDGEREAGNAELLALAIDGLGEPFHSRFESGRPRSGACEGDQNSTLPSLNSAVQFCGSRLAWPMKG